MNPPPFLTGWLPLCPLTLPEAGVNGDATAIPGANVNALSGYTFTIEVAGTFSIDDFETGVGGVNCSVAFDFTFAFTLATVGCLPLCSSLLEPINLVATQATVEGGSSGTFSITGPDGSVTDSGSATIDAGSNTDEEDPPPELFATVFNDGTGPKLYIAWQWHCTVATGVGEHGTYNLGLESNGFFAQISSDSTALDCTQFNDPPPDPSDGSGTVYTGASGTATMLGATLTWSSCSPATSLTEGATTIDESATVNAVTFTGS